MGEKPAKRQTPKPPKTPAPIVKKTSNKGQPKPGEGETKGPR